MLFSGFSILQFQLTSYSKYSYIYKWLRTITENYNIKNYYHCNFNLPLVFIFFFSRSSGIFSWPNGHQNKDYIPPESFAIMCAHVTCFSSVGDKEKQKAIESLITLKAPKHIKQVLIDPKGEIDSNRVIGGDFNTPLSTMDRSSREKINRET